MTKLCYTLALLLLPTALANGADHPFMTFRPLSLSEDPAGTPVADYGSYEELLTAKPLHDGARTVIESASRYTRDVFHLPQLTLVKAATFNEAEGDGFVANWTFSGKYSGTVTINDTPLLSRFVLRFPASPVDIGELRSLLSELVAYGPPVSILKVEVLYRGDLSGIERFWAKPTRTPSSFMLIRDFGGLIGERASDGSMYISASLSKGVSEGYFETPPFVAERFPPLSELVRSWPDSRIRAELGRLPSLQHARYLTENRDTILLGELVRRGLSTQEFVQLLTGGDGDLAQRAQVLLRVASMSDAEFSFEKYVRAALARYTEIGPGAALAVSEVTGSYTRCSPVLEAEMLNQLQGGLFVESAMSYLGRCSVSEEALEALARTAVSPDKARSKEFSARAIKRNLERKKQEKE
jgi:hypothetical protein